MGTEILKLNEFGDIAEYVKDYVSDYVDWQRTLLDSDLVELNEADLQICRREETPRKEPEAPNSIWKKMIDYRSIPFF
jgi:hypothetical protein